MSSTWTIYKETIWWKEMIAILVTMAVLFLSLSLFFLLGSTDDEHLLLFITFLINGVMFIFLTYYFRKLNVELTNEGVCIGWQYRKKEYAWADIEKVWKDERNVMRYSGYGIRVARINETWILVYNVIMADRVVIKLKEGKFGEFVFSTKDADQVIRHIEQNIHRK